MLAGIQPLIAHAATHPDQLAFGILPAYARELDALATAAGVSPIVLRRAYLVVDAMCSAVVRLGDEGRDEEIAKFCSSYHVTFPLFSKIAVTGPGKHPLYAALIAAKPEHVVYGPWREGLTDYAAKNGFPPPNPLPELLWNFEKFLIGRDGKVLARFAPDTPPDDPRITEAIEAALA